MRISDLIRSIREPPPESLVGYMTRFEGRFMRNMPFMILINLAWIFAWPLIAGESFVGVILPTLLAALVCVYLHLSTYFYGGPAHVRLRYIFGEHRRGFEFAPFNPSSLGFLIFAFFVTAFALPTRYARYVIFGSIVLFGIEMLLIGLNGQSLAYVMLPLVLLAITALYTAYTGQQQMALRRSNEEIMRLATLAERERIGRDLHDSLGHTLSVVALKSELARKLARSRSRGRRAGKSAKWSAWRAMRCRRFAVRSRHPQHRLPAEIVAATALLEARVSR
jgi:two-component system sensor histidine kinase DesK